MHLQIAYANQFVTVTGNKNELRLQNNYWQNPFDTVLIQ